MKKNEKTENESDYQSYKEYESSFGQYFTTILQKKSVFMNHVVLRKYLAIIQAENWIKWRI